MKSLMRLACLGAVAMAFVACEEDKHICTLPSFAGFRIEPTVWNAGDSVTITAVQQSLGDLLYKAEYHWSVECTDTTFTKDYNVVYDADKSNPYIGIRLPDDFRGRMAKINFSVQYSYSATAPQSAPSGSNLVKLELGVGKGKKLYDKRQDIAKKDAERRMQKAMRQKIRDNS